MQQVCSAQTVMNVFLTFHAAIREGTKCKPQLLEELSGQHLWRNWIDAISGLNTFSD